MLGFLLLEIRERVKKSSYSIFETPHYFVLHNHVILTFLRKSNQKRKRKSCKTGVSVIDILDCEFINDIRYKIRIGTRT